MSARVRVGGGGAAVRPANIHHWTSDHVLSWLSSLSIKPTQALRNSHVDGPALHGMTLDDVCELWFSERDSKRIIKERDALLLPVDSFYGVEPMCKTPRSLLYQVRASFLTDHFRPVSWLQRDVETDRVDAIVDKALQTTDQPHFPGTICIYDFGGQLHPQGIRQRGIFDGQHRTNALYQILHERRKTDPAWDVDVVIEVFSVTSEAEVRRLFVDVNQAQPVQPYVIDFIHREHRTVADEAVKLLMCHDPKWAKELFRNPPTTPHAPHIKASQLASALAELRGPSRRQEP